MTRNRAGTHRAPREGDGPLRHTVGGLLTLILLAPSAALLAARVRGLLDLERLGPLGCTGLDSLGPVLRLGLPTIALTIAIPVALLSLGHRARGWIWLAVVLVGTLALEVALRWWLPACL